MNNDEKDQSDKEDSSGHKAELCCTTPQLSMDSTTQKETTTKASKKKVYKSRLSYKSQWESTYPWVYCTKVEDGIFCRLCQAYSKPQPTARGGWTTQGIIEWNHANELLKQHNDSIKCQQWQQEWQNRQMCMNYNVAQLLRVPRREGKKQEIASVICLLFSKTQYSTHYKLP